MTLACMCVTFDFEIKYQHSWFTAHLVNKSHSCLLPGVKHHITLMQISCSGRDAWNRISLGNLQAIQAATTHVDLLCTNKHILAYDWPVRRSITVGCSERACGFFIVTNVCVTEQAGLVRVCVHISWSFFPRWSVSMTAYCKINK